MQPGGDSFAFVRLQLAAPTSTRGNFPAKRRENEPSENRLVVHGILAAGEANTEVEVGLRIAARGTAAANQAEQADSRDDLRRNAMTKQKALPKGT
jgi:hypothetical protein